jgi:heptosyltransferase-2
MPSTRHPERILAVKLADLGDLLTVTPALQALRAAHPSARIDLLVPPSSAHLLRGSRFLDEIVTFDKFAFDSLRGLLSIRSLLSTLGFLLKLRRGRYDTLILFHHFTTRWGTVKFAMLSLASDAGTRAGLDNGRGWFLTHRVADQGFGMKHEADYWLDVASMVGGDKGAGWRPQMPITESDRAVSLDLVSDITGSPIQNPKSKIQNCLVAIHPGAGAYSPARIWSLDGFAEVARGLIDSHDAAIIVLGGPDEVDRAARLEGMIGKGGRVLNLAGRTSIHETAAIIERCDLFIGNDSGPMHIAAAMGTPVVAVFGPSNQRAWDPYTPPGEKSIHTTVSRDLPCQPCFYRAHSLGLREGCGPRPCLTGLGYERVLDACKKVLGEEQR